MTNSAPIRVLTGPADPDWREARMAAICQEAPGRLLVARTTRRVRDLQDRLPRRLGRRGLAQRVVSVDELIGSWAGAAAAGRRMLGEAARLYRMQRAASESLDRVRLPEAARTAVLRGAAGGDLLDLYDLLLKHGHPPESTDLGPGVLCELAAAAFRVYAASIEPGEVEEPRLRLELRDHPDPPPPPGMSLPPVLENPVGLDPVDEALLLRMLDRWGGEVLVGFVGDGLGTAHAPSEPAGAVQEPDTDNLGRRLCYGILRRAGAEHIRVPDQPPPESAERRALSRCLGKSSSAPELPADLTVTAVHDPGAEVLEAAARIRSLLEQDAAPERIVVLFPSLERYAARVDELFPRFGIPYELSVTGRPNDARCVRAALRCLEAADGDPTRSELVHLAEALSGAGATVRGEAGWFEPDAVGIDEVLRGGGDRVLGESGSAMGVGRRESVMGDGGRGAAAEGEHGEPSLPEEGRRGRDSSGPGGDDGPERSLDEREATSGPAARPSHPGDPAAQLRALLAALKMEKEAAPRDLARAVAALWERCGIQRLAVGSGDAGIGDGRDESTRRRFELAAAKVLFELLAELADELERAGVETITLKETAVLLRTLQARREVSARSPVERDCVRVTARLGARDLSMDHLVIGGLGEGSFPSAPRRPSFLSERRAEELGIDKDRRAEDLWLLARYLSNPRVSTHVVFSSNDAEHPAPAPLLMDLLERVPGVEGAKDVGELLAEVLEHKPLWSGGRARLFGGGLVAGGKLVAGGRKDLSGTGSLGEGLGTSSLVSGFSNPDPLSYLLTHPSPHALQRALAAEHERRDYESSPGPYDGVLTAPALVSAAAAHPTIRGRQSAARLGTYLRCPYRFMAERLWGLLEDDEHEDEVSPLIRGQLLHDIMERFHRRRLAESRLDASEADWPAWARAALTELFDQAWDDLPWALRGDPFFEHHRIRIAAGLEDEDPEVRGALRRFVDFEAEGDHRYRPLFAEAVFGAGEAAPDADVVLDRDLVITSLGASSHGAGDSETSDARDGRGGRRGDGRGVAPDESGAAVLSGESGWAGGAGARVRVAGRIDRIDERADSNAVRVIDYKLSRADSKNAIARGRSPQLPIYALAAEAAGFKAAAAGYVVLDSSDYAPVKLSARLVDPELGEKRNRGQNLEMSEALEAARAGLPPALEGMRSGLFHHGAGSDGDRGCSYCPHKVHCRKLENVIGEREHGDRLSFVPVTAADLVPDEEPKP